MDLFTIRQVAERGLLMGYRYQTIKDFENKGLLDSIDISARGSKRRMIRISTEAIEKFKKRRGLRGSYNLVTDVEYTVVNEPEQKRLKKTCNK